MFEHVSTYEGASVDDKGKSTNGTLDNMVTTYQLHSFLQQKQGSHLSPN